MFVTDLKRQDYERFKYEIERGGVRNSKAVSYDYPIEFNEKEYLLRLQFTHKINVVALQAYSISADKIITDNRILSTLLEVLMFQIIHEPNENAKDSYFGIYEGLLGENKASNVLPDISNWIMLAQNIREKLEDKFYLLDEYLHLIFLGLDVNPIDSVVYEASDEANKLLIACNHYVLNNENKDIKYYSLVEDFAKDHLVDFKESGTEINYYFSVLLDTVFRMSFEDFYNQAKPNVKGFDIVRIREIFKQIEELLIDDYYLIYQLDSQLKDYFTSVTTAQIYAQHFTQTLLGSMLSKDIESNKYMFQIMLD